MKKIHFFLSLLAMVFVASACSEQSNVNPSESKFVEVAIPTQYKTNANGRSSNNEDVDDMIFDIQITTAEGVEVDGQVHFVMPNNETLSYFAMTDNLLSATGLSADYWVEAFNSEGLQGTNPNARAGGCFAGCREMKRGEGRGACRAECWLGVAVKIAGIWAVIK